MLLRQRWLTEHYQNKGKINFMTKSLPVYEKLTFSEKDRVLNEFKAYLTDLENLKKKAK